MFCWSIFLDNNLFGLIKINFSDNKSHKTFEMKKMHLKWFHSKLYSLLWLLIRVADWLNESSTATDESFWVKTKKNEKLTLWDTKRSHWWKLKKLRILKKLESQFIGDQNFNSAKIFWRGLWNLDSNGETNDSNYYRANTGRFISCFWPSPKN